MFNLVRFVNLPSPLQGANVLMPKTMLPNKTPVPSTSTTGMARRLSRKASSPALGARYAATALIRSANGPSWVPKKLRAMRLKRATRYVFSERASGCSLPRYVAVRCDQGIWSLVVAGPAAAFSESGGAGARTRPAEVGTAKSYS